MFQHNDFRLHRIMADAHRESHPVNTQQPFPGFPFGSQRLDPGRHTQSGLTPDFFSSSSEAVFFFPYVFSFCFLFFWSVLRGEKMLIVYNFCVPLKEENQKKVTHSLQHFLFV